MTAAKTSFAARGKREKRKGQTKETYNSPPPYEKHSRINSLSSNTIPQTIAKNFYACPWRLKLDIASMIEESTINQHHVPNIKPTQSHQ